MPSPTTSPGTSRGGGGGGGGRVWLACGSSSQVPRVTTIGGSSAAAAPATSEYTCTHTSCSVCLEDLDVLAKGSDKPTVLRPCKHAFHRACIKTWFVAEMRRGKGVLSCPLCRSEVVPRQSVLTKSKGVVAKGFNKAASLFSFRSRVRRLSDDGLRHLPESPTVVIDQLLA